MKGGVGNRLSSELLERFLCHCPFCSRMSCTLTFLPPLRHEIFFIKATSSIQALNVSYNIGLSALLVLLVFAPYVLSGGTLSLRAYFVTLSLVNRLRVSILIFFNESFLYSMEYQVAATRIQVKNLVIIIHCIVEKPYFSIGYCLPVCV